LGAAKLQSAPDADNPPYAAHRAMGAEPSLPEKLFNSARKNCYANLSDSPHPVIISKNPGFRALYLARQNEFRFLFNKYKFFFIFGCWLLPEKFGFCPKNNGFARVRGLQLPSPLDRTPMFGSGKTAVRPGGR